MSAISSIETLKSVRPFFHRIGRRGGALLFLAFIDFVYAYSFAYPPKEILGAPVFKFYNEILPIKGWALIWLTVGIVCFIGAFFKRDAFSFATAMMMKMIWGLVNLFSWFSGVDRGYLSASVWFVFAGFLAILAGWPEKEHRAESD